MWGTQLSQGLSESAKEDYACLESRMPASASAKGVVRIFFDNNVVAWRWSMGRLSRGSVELDVAVEVTKFDVLHDLKLPFDFDSALSLSSHLVPSSSFFVSWAWLAESCD